MMAHGSLTICTCIPFNTVTDRRMHAHTHLLNWAVDISPYSEL